MRKSFIKSKSIFIILLVFLNISFLIPPKKSEAIVPLIIGGIAITAELAVPIGTALLTFGGYAAIQSDRGQAILDQLARGLVSMGTTGIQIAKDGTVFVSNKAWSFIDSLINKLSAPYVQGNINQYLSFTEDVFFNNKSYGPGFAFLDSSKVIYSEAPYFSFGVSGNVLFPPYLNPPSGSPISSYIVRSISSTYSFKLSNGGQSNSAYWVSGFRSSSFDYVYVPGTAYFIPSGSVSADWKPAYPTYTGQDVFPSSKSYESDREDAGVVLKPKAKDLDLSNTYEDWLNPSISTDIANPTKVRDIVDTGVGEVTDGILDDSIPREGTDNPSIPGTIPSDWTVPNKLELDFSPLYVATNKFPFCLPFDVYNLIKSFETGRKAPVFKVSFDKVAQVTGIGGGEFSIDFGNEQFSKIVLVFRTFVLFAFCIMLAFKTKSIMGW